MKGRGSELVLQVLLLLLLGNGCVDLQLVLQNLCLYKSLQSEGMAGYKYLL